MRQGRNTNLKLSENFVRLNLPSAFAVSASALLVTCSLTPSNAGARTTHAVRLAAVHAKAAAAAQYPSFDVAVFARGSASLYNPDGIVVTKHAVFVDYQNESDTKPKPSTIVKYDFSGHIVGAVNINGRCDGMRLNPSTHKLWALVNNDGLNGMPARQPALYVIDPKTLQATRYAFAASTQPHGGGYDDLAFIGGKAYFSASAPTLTPAGVNNKQIAVEADIRGGKVEVAPIAYGNLGGLVNIADPDSLAVDNANDLIIVSEGDGQLVTVRNPQTKYQTQSSIHTGSQLDDVAFTTGTSGTLFVADSTLNRIYQIRSAFPTGTVFAEAPLGAPAQSFIGTLDTTTGTVTPLLTVRDGILDPTSLIFVPTSGGQDDS